MSYPIQKVILASLEEDCWHDDVTGSAVFSKENPTVEAKIFAKQAGVFSGEEVVAAFQQVVPHMGFTLKVKEGDALEVGKTLVELQGSMQLILKVERTLLNLLSRSCGIATLTREYVRRMNPKVKLLATRKTTPLLREIELKAVEAGGGKTHRRSLSDGILIKENHLMKSSAQEALKLAHEKKSPLHKIEIEVQSLELLDEVLKGPYLPDIIMLDNFSLDLIEFAAKKISKKCLIEVSGGVNLDTIGEISKLDIDFISVGKLTHSAPILDLSLDIL